MNVEDVPTYTKWLNDPKITQYMSSHNALISLVGEKAYLEENANSEFILAIVKKENDELLGSIGIERINYKDGTAELGIMIGEEANHSKGYGSEAVKLLTDYAFKELRLHTIMLRTLDINERAQRAYKKCGFKEFGRRHESRFTDGKYHDMVYMELINKE